MISDLDQLIDIQVVYIIILLAIIWGTRKGHRVKIAARCIAVAYALIIGWLTYVYFSFGNHPDPGAAFGWAMASIIFPGILVIIAIGTFAIYWIANRGK